LQIIELDTVDNGFRFWVLFCGTFQVSVRGYIGERSLMLLLIFYILALQHLVVGISSWNIF